MTLPQNARDELARAIEALRDEVPGARWIPPQNLHCTLAFLGKVQDARIPPVSDALGAAVSEHVDFPVTLGELGAFPDPTRARVLWASLRDAAGGVAAIASSVQEALQPLGFEPESRPFRAHVTLARLQPPRAVTLQRTLEPVRFTVDRLTLYESKLGKGPAVYEALATFPFRRELAPPRPD